MILSHSRKICDISPILTARPLKQQPRPPFRRVKVRLEATNSLCPSLSSTDRTLLFPRHGSGIYIFSLYFLGDVILQTARVVALSALAPTQVLIKCRTFLDVSWKTNALLSRGIKLHQASGNWPRKLRSMQSWLGSLQSRVYYNARVCSTAALQGVGEE